MQCLCARYKTGHKVDGLIDLSRRARKEIVSKAFSSIRTDLSVSMCIELYVYVCVCFTFFSFSFVCHCKKVEIGSAESMCLVRRELIGLKLDQLSEWTKLFVCCADIFRICKKKLSTFQHLTCIDLLCTVLQWSNKHYITFRTASN